MAAGIKRIGIRAGLAIEHGTQATGGDLHADIISGVRRAGICTQKRRHVRGSQFDFGDLAGGFPFESKIAGKFGKAADGQFDGAAEFGGARIDGDVV